MSRDDLLERVRKTLKRRKGITEKRMFGGNCFFANGNMIGGVSGEGELMIRVGPEAYENALAQPHASKMDFTGRPMRGFVVIDSDGFADDDSLKIWIDRGASYARSLPAK